MLQKVFDINLYKRMWLYLYSSVAISMDKVKPNMRTFTGYNQRLKFEKFMVMISVCLEICAFFTMPRICIMN
jgi:hypothetical protein